MESSTKKYGLTVPKKRLDGIMKATNVFGDDSDSENEVKNKPIQTNNRTKAQQRSAKLVIDKALEEDSTVFQYDEVYDDMEKKKENLDERKKKVDKKPRYIQNLLIQAEKRKIEYERRNERLIQKEREAEGDEFRDKEAFVTSSYKKKLEEMKKMDEEDMKLSMIEDINDKQRDMGSFYRNLYKKELCKEENDEKIEEIKKTIKKSDASRQYRKRASSKSSDDDAENDKDTDISDTDSNSSVDSTKRRKIENRNEKKSEEKEIIDKPEKKLLVIEKPRENLEDEQSIDDESKSKEIAKEKLKDKKIEQNKPKVNIWEKRTVGDIYEAARQRYFERKMKQININVRT